MNVQSTLIQKTVDSGKGKSLKAKYIAKKP
jgi:hypothetical protein